MYIVHAVPLFLAFMREQKIIPHYLRKQYGLALVLKINNYWSQLPTLLLQCRSAWLNSKGVGYWSRVTGTFVLCACGTPFNSLAVLVNEPNGLFWPQLILKYMPFVSLPTKPTLVTINQVHNRHLYFNWSPNWHFLTTQSREKLTSLESPFIHHLIKLQGSNATMTKQ